MSGLEDRFLSEDEQQALAQMGVPVGAVVDLVRLGKPPLRLLRTEAGWFRALEGTEPRVVRTEPGPSRSLVQPGAHIQWEVPRMSVSTYPTSWNTVCIQEESAWSTAHSGLYISRDGDINMSRTGISSRRSKKTDYPTLEKFRKAFPFDRVWSHAQMDSLPEHITVGGLEYTRSTPMNYDDIPSDVRDHWGLIYLCSSRCWVLPVGQGSEDSDDEDPQAETIEMVECACDGVTAQEYDPSAHGMHLPPPVYLVEDDEDMGNLPRNLLGPVWRQNEDGSWYLWLDPTRPSDPMGLLRGQPLVYLSLENLRSRFPFSGMDPGDLGIPREGIAMGGVIWHFAGLLDAEELSVPREMYEKRDAVMWYSGHDLVPAGWYLALGYLQGTSTLVMMRSLCAPDQVAVGDMVHIVDDRVDLVGALKRCVTYVRGHCSLLLRYGGESILHTLPHPIEVPCDVIYPSVQAEAAQPAPARVHEMGVRPRSRYGRGALLVRQERPDFDTLRCLRKEFPYDRPLSWYDVPESLTCARAIWNGPFPLRAGALNLPRQMRQEMDRVIWYSGFGVLPPGWYIAAGYDSERDEWLFWRSTAEPAPAACGDIIYILDDRADAVDAIRSCHTWNTHRDASSGQLRPQYCHRTYTYDGSALTEVKDYFAARLDRASGATSTVPVPQTGSPLMDALALGTQMRLSRQAMGLGARLTAGLLVRLGIPAVFLESAEGQKVLETLAPFLLYALVTHGGQLVPLPQAVLALARQMALHGIVAVTYDSLGDITAFLQEQVKDLGELMTAFAATSPPLPALAAESPLPSMATAEEVIA